MEENNEGEDDEEEWEDASDEDDEDMEEGSDSEQDSRGDEKKDKGKEKPAKNKSSSTSPAARSRPTLAGSPKEQRTPRPKVHIPPPAAVQESPEGGKPLSPFSPLYSHQPVSDWGEEMEMQSPRSSMGGESPLKPPSVESSPPQKQEQEVEAESQAASSSEPAEPQRVEDTGRILTQVSLFQNVYYTVKGSVSSVLFHSDVSLQFVGIEICLQKRDAVVLSFSS